MEETFEELMDELKKIVRKLEEGSSGLDESIRLYERGCELIRKCEKRLEYAEQRISQLDPGV
jgi:exodeoxyribonuclease VII small subunit